MRPLPAADAEAIAEEFIGAATGAESVSEDAQDEVVDEEAGGPFIVLDDDASLPTEPEEGKQEREGHGPVQHEQTRRAGRWAAKGA